METGTIPNCETVEELLALQTRLMDLKDMVGWLCTCHRSVVGYKNNPEASKRVQKQLDQAAEFADVVYINSILDEAGFRPNNQWVSSDDKAEFKAWVHIRHTGAHAPDGRARVYYADFDE